MCYETKCTNCRKRSWGGCGRHVRSIAASIPIPERCACVKWPNPNEPPTFWENYGSSLVLLGAFLAVFLVPNLAIADPVPAILMVPATMLSPLLPSGIPGLYSTASVHDLRQFIDSSPWTNPSASDPKSQKVLILDVREPSELSLLPAIDTPATIAVPMSSFRHDALRLIRRKVDELRRVHGDSASENSPTTLKDVHVHIMCASGTRAVKAAVALGWEGLFGDVSVVTGGMQSWGRMAPETKAATSRRRAE